MKTVFPLIFILLFFSNCSKKIECNNAELTVENIGTDTIYYCWNCNFMEDTLPPGQKARTMVGSIFIHKDLFTDEEQVKWTSFNSTHGNYFIKVDDCLVEKIIE